MRLKLIVIVFVTLLVIYALLHIFFKLKYPFWYTQPVFHFYNFSYWLNPPGLLQSELPPVLFSYLNQINIRTIDVGATDLTTDVVTLKRACQVVKDHFVYDPHVTYKPSQTDILAPLSNSQQHGYLSVYEMPRLLFDTTTATPDKEVLAVFSARSLNVKKNKDNLNLAFSLYYVDNLCVHPSYRQKNIAPQMIYTTYYNLRRMNPNINTFMFKREGQLNAMVPFIIYQMVALDLSTLAMKKPSPIHAAYQILEISEKKEHVNLLWRFLTTEELDKLFDWTFIPDMTNLTTLLKTKSLLIKGIFSITEDKLVGIYVFRQSELYYKNRKIINLVTSCFLKSSCSQELFLTVFQNLILAATTMLIEETGYNANLTTALLRLNATQLFKSPAAYYLYNYASYSCKSEKVLLLF